MEAIKMSEYQQDLFGNFAVCKENEKQLKEDMRLKKIRNFIESNKTEDNDCNLEVEYQPSLNSNGDFTGYQAIYRGE